MLRFHSDYSIAGAGFSATWEAVDISGCPLQTLTAREAGRRIWLEFVDYDLGSNSQNGKDSHFGEQSFNEAILEVDLSGGNRPFQPFQVPGHLTDGAYLSEGERMHIRLRTADKPGGIGFKAVYRTVAQIHEERLIDLSNVTVGTLLHLNYPKPAPPHVEFVQHLIAPVGHVIMLELYQMTPSDGKTCPGGAGIIEVTDNYADANGTWWFLCESNPGQEGRIGSSTLAITSYFNTLYIRQRSGATGVRLNATVKVYPGKINL
ncbi:hypothetical protein C0J52_23227 [Blattella germanica]|nr:hypothetical protein C0J52_23227 [Blattella germanica]